VEFSLRDFQVEAVHRFFEKVNSDITRQLIVLPPATGKTLIAAAISKQFHKESNKERPILFLVHRDELMNQTIRIIQLMWKGATIGRIKGSENNQNAMILVASIQTLVRGRKLNNPPSLVIYDEAQHSLSKGSIKLLHDLGCFTNGGPILLGLTATPDRSDNRSLFSVFQEVVYQKDITEMIRSGYLTEIKERKIVIRNLNTSQLPSVSGDYDIDLLGDTMSKNDVVKEIVKSYREHAIGLKTIIFTVTKRQSDVIVTELMKEGIRAVSIDSSHSAKKRTSILIDFCNDKYRVLVNCSLLAEGYDQPDVSCVIIARPTRNKGLYTQMIGRGLSLHPSKEHCLVLDVVGENNDRSLVTSYELFRSSEIERKNIEKTKVRTGSPSRTIDFPLQGAKRDNANIPTKHQRYKWIQLTSAAYFINLGKKRSVFLLSEDQNRWWTLFEDYDKRIYPLYPDALPIEYAQGIAENFMSEIETPLFAIHAKWRKRPISITQKSVLKKHNIDFDLSWTMGEAADKLDYFFGSNEVIKLLKRFCPVFTRRVMRNELLRQQIEFQFEKAKTSFKQNNNWS